MNERIHEFAEQAEFLYMPSKYPDMADLYQCANFKLEKFVELIVEECRYVMDCNKGSDQHTEWNRALFETSLKIKQHFGVE